MIIYWIVYLILSFIISILISKFFLNHFMKILIFSISFALLTTIWFKTPGSNYFAPIFSILLVESSIIVNNGFYRILRPLSITFVIILSFSLLFWKRKPKS